MQTDRIRLYRDDEGYARIEGAEHVIKHSPSGIEWGYGGSGPADCARSILIHFLGKEIADRYYQIYKHDVIAGLPRQGAAITRGSVIDWYKDNKDRR